MLLCSFHNCHCCQAVPDCTSNNTVTKPNLSYPSNPQPSRGGDQHHTSQVGTSVFNLLPTYEDLKSLFIYDIEYNKLAPASWSMFTIVLTIQQVQLQVTQYMTEIHQNTQNSLILLL